MTDTDINVLAAEMRALRELLETKLDDVVGDVANLNQNFSDISRTVVTTEVCQYKRTETQRMILRVAEHDTRLTRLERVYWLQVGLYGLITPIIIWYAIRLLSSGTP